ncbi:MAG: FkbM family methyltransferase [Magnetococcales bacterium]|nr:FkbM family methyltransferase [Magnetococcales bacterium]
MPALTLDEAVRHSYQQLREGKISEARELLQRVLSHIDHPDAKRLLMQTESLLPLEQVVDSLRHISHLMFQAANQEVVSNWLAGQRLYRDLLAEECYADPRRLERFGAKFYSQNDEDGIIAEIFRRIGTTNRIFVEFGVNTGLENNTLLLTYQDWQGVWMDGSEQNIAFIRRKFAPLIERQRLQVAQQWIRVETINQVLQSFRLPEEIDLVSIDIDGNDYYIFESMTAVRPRVCVIEYNAKLPPPILAVMRYDAEWMVHELTDYFGCSLAALTRMANRKGYQLVGCNITGINAFFVRDDLCGDLFYQPATAEALYQPPRYGFHHAGTFRVGHPTSYGPWQIG